MTDVRFKTAVERFDDANRADPHTQHDAGVDRPRELVYAERMTQWLDRLEPDASEALRLAARSQHICRWKIPRTRYPMDRAGYLAWRKELAEFHARTAAEILTDVGYDSKLIERVQDLLKKKNIKGDAETQTLEDLACLVFLELDFAEFAGKHEACKILNILRRTWKKMSPRGRQMALTLGLPPDARALLDQALAE